MLECELLECEVLEYMTASMQNVRSTNYCTPFCFPMYENKTTLNEQSADRDSCTVEPKMGDAKRCKMLSLCTGNVQMRRLKEAIRLFVTARPSHKYDKTAR
jgi:hypothetical protein